ncbi:hypothetical protein GCM10025867_36050 [Frondihabitans sucicola]|uniref:MFS transporter permease n=1 Tax=Frondihabitans sucicola TaxID=1268041 RepID=A0ABM8GSA5_9MICO|nr:hypothetical protein [Frondihabitans sucicola]BDZ51364.1 hypothetical protein GCM10025867_36050 [Frondihabitans sucicola]
MRTSAFDRRHRPRSVWFAFGTGSVLSLVIAFGVLLPLLGLVGASLAAAPVVHIPLARIAVTLVAGYLLALGLLVWTARRRHGPVAWFFAVAAVICTLVISVSPALAVALTAVHTGGEVIPFISDWVRRGSAVFNR